MAGGLGNDTYSIDSVGDVVTEAANAGTDTVRSWINYTLGDNLENLTLVGSANTNATGNALNNILTGNAGSNVLDGQAGDDTLIGNAGDDTYQVDSEFDLVIENPDEGTDTVISTADSYTLGDSVENLTLMSGALWGFGNTLANVMTGKAADNNLFGFDGNDT